VRQGQPTGFLVFSHRVAVATGRDARGDAGIGIGIGLHTLTLARSPAPEARQTIDQGVSLGSPAPNGKAPAGRQNPLLPLLPILVWRQESRQRVGGFIE
jgi:hypothetical protein